MRCADASREAGEPLAGSAPTADVWVVVEHPAGWGDAPLARSGRGVRILMARGPRRPPPSEGPPDRRAGPLLPLPAAGAGFRVWVAHCSPDPVLRTGSVSDPAEVADWDPAAIAAGSHRDWGDPDPDPLLLVCANGRRDRCCGHSGGRLADRLWAGPYAERILTCTHLSGHRFAPTALLLPIGALHGRLDHATATGLLAAAWAGWMPADRLRGFSSLSEPAQVADAYARQALGVTTDRPMPVDLVAARDGDQLRALVALPGASCAEPDRGRAGRVLEVPLVRTSREVIASCGGAVAATSRWVVGAGPAAP